MTGKKVVVGMSGGVDSSTVAAMLVEQGYDVSGAIMMIYDESNLATSGRGHACYGPEELDDLEDAKQVCDQLGIDLHVIDLSRQYGKAVLDYVRTSYLQGKTPNPCVKCNLQMKFGLLLDQLEKTNIAFDYFATGHYARIEKKDGFYYLKKAQDTRKDQTYFIYALGQKILSRCLFPLGELTKGQVRELSQKYNLSVSEKTESQNFISGGYGCLFKGLENKGDIVDSEGRILGRHNGIFNYTVGQRKGLGIASEEPYYVVRLDSSLNRVVVGRKSDLFHSSLKARNVFWVKEPAGDQPLAVSAKIRYASPDADAVVANLPDGFCRVDFSEPQMAITAGQAIVFYQDDCVVGGGEIVSTL